MDLIFKKSSLYPFHYTALILSLFFVVVFCTPSISRPAHASVVIPDQSPQNLGGIFSSFFESTSQRQMYAACTLGKISGVLKERVTLQSGEVLALNCLDGYTGYFDHCPGIAICKRGMWEFGCHLPGRGAQFLKEIPPCVKE